MNRFKQNSQIGIVFLLVFFLTLSCKDNSTDLNPLLVENLKKLEKDEFLAKASYSEKLLYNDLLISETHGEGYFVSAGPHYIIENGRMAFFPTQLELRERDYPIIQKSLNYVYDAVPEITSLVDLPLGFRSVPNSIARVFKSNLLNLDKAGKNISYQEVKNSEDNLEINFSQLNSSSPYPLKGTFTFDKQGVLSKVEFVNYNSYSQVFWEFLQGFNFSNFTIYFEEQADRLTITKAQINYEKEGYKHTIEMTLADYKDVEVSFLDTFYSPIVINETNPYIFKKYDMDMSRTHKDRESKYYFIDTDSVKHTPMSITDTLILKEIITSIENEKY